MSYRKIAKPASQSDLPRCPYCKCLCANQRSLDDHLHNHNDSRRVVPGEPVRPVIVKREATA